MATVSIANPCAPYRQSSPVFVMAAAAAAAATDIPQPPRRRRRHDERPLELTREHKKTHTEEITDMCVSRDGRFVVTGSSESVSLRHVDSAESVSSWNGDLGFNPSIKVGVAITAAATSLADSKAGNAAGEGRLVVHGRRRGVVVRSAASGQVLRTLATGLESQVTFLTLNHIDTVVASGTMSGKIVLLNLASGEVLATLSGHTRPVECLVFSNDDKLLFSSSWDEAIRVWDVENGSDVLHVMEGHTHWVMWISMSPCGGFLASASYDETVKIWRLSGDFDCVHTIDSPFTWGQAAVSYSPCGRYLAAAGRDKRVRVFETDEFSLLYELDDVGSEIRCMAFAGSSHSIVAGSIDGTLRFYGIPNRVRLLAFVNGFIRRAGVRVEEMNAMERTSRNRLCDRNAIALIKEWL